MHRCTQVTRDLDHVMWQENDVIKQADAYVVIYSMTDRSSYQWAYSFIDDVTQARSDVTADDVRLPSHCSPTVDVVILVANKSDLVRKRQVSTEGKVLVQFSVNEPTFANICTCETSLPFSPFLSWVTVLKLLSPHQKRSFQLQMHQMSFGGRAPLGEFKWSSRV